MSAAKQGENQRNFVFYISQGGKYADLTVFDIARLTAILAGDTNRFGSFLRDAELINNEAGVFVSTNQTIGIGGNLCSQVLFVPGRLG